LTSPSPYLSTFFGSSFRKMLRVNLSHSHFSCLMKFTHLGYINYCLIYLVLVMRLNHSIYLS